MHPRSHHKGVTSNHDLLFSSVEDQNDNDPRFEMAKYVAAIAEDIPIGTSVLTVKAIDGDLGINARIIYSLANETEWLFSIDNRTGLITTAG